MEMLKFGSAVILALAVPARGNAQDAVNVKVAQNVWAGAISVRVLEIERIASGSITPVALPGTRIDYRVRIEFTNRSRADVDVRTLPGLYLFFDDSSKSQMGFPHIADPERPGYFRLARDGERIIAKGASWTGNYVVPISSGTSDSARLLKAGFRYPQEQDSYLYLKLPSR